MRRRICFKQYLSSPQRRKETYRGCLFPLSLIQYTTGIAIHALPSQGKLAIRGCDGIFLGIHIVIEHQQVLPKGLHGLTLYSGLTLRRVHAIAVRR